MSQTTKEAGGAPWVTRVVNQLVARRKKLPESFLKAAGIIRNRKQRLDLERHVRKMRAEWR